MVTSFLLLCATPKLTARKAPRPEAKKREAYLWQTKGLTEMSLSAEGWRVVVPAYGDIKDNVWLQKDAPRAADVKNARLYLPRRDLEDYDKS